jgi:phage terminase large subunit
MYVATTATGKVARMTARLRCIQGGTSASKSISILLILIALAQTDKKPTLTSIVSESLPHLKKGLIRDFLLIMNEHQYYDDERWNRTDFTYTFESGSQIEFFSVDQPDKVRGPRRNRLFINEANNVPYESFDQLEVRTKEFIFMDWNPTNEFWFYTDVLPLRTDIEHITLTYLDNEALEPAIVASIEQRKGNKGWWKVYGLGQLGEVDGKIYKDWAIIDEIPHEATLLRYGVDFGYTDPTAIVAIYGYLGGYIVEELAFQKEMSNSQIAALLLNKPRALIVADSADPKSIADIQSHGLTIVGADKGRDSVINGISNVQEQRISVTRDSSNVIKEYRNYLWVVDKNGKIASPPVPEHDYSHCFAPQSLIHTTEGIKTIKSLVGKEGYLYSKNNTIQKFHSVKQTRKNTEVLNITFDDNKTLSVTPDHLLLLPSGKWVEAGLLCPLDMIQSVIYKGNPNIQWFQFLQIQGFKVLQRVCWWKENILAPLYLGSNKWRYSKGLPHSSQGPQSREQRSEQFGIDIKNGTLEASFRKPIRSGKTKEKRMDKKDITTYKEVAWVRTGKGVAQVTWKEGVCKEDSRRKRMRSLSQKISNTTDKQSSNKVLSSELQNESKTKKIIRITRGLCNVTYNLEVEKTHCALVDGVIAHNSMDSTRYAIMSILKKGSGGVPKVSFSATARYGPKKYTKFNIR